MSNAVSAFSEKPETHSALIVSMAKDIPDSVLPDVILVAAAIKPDTSLRETITDVFMRMEPSLVVVDCRQRLDFTAWVGLLREYPRGRECHVVVLTHDAKDWMQCMALDVDDIVYAKPAEPFLASYATVMARFMRSLELRSQIIKHGVQAHNAIVTAAEYGALLHFMEAAESRTDLAGLANLVLKRLRENHLDAIIQVSTPSGSFFYPADGVAESHANLIKKLAESPQRMIAFERFLGFRYGGFTLLVTNAPHENPHLYGQIKDSLAHLCAIAESRAKGILVKQSINDHHHHLLEMLDVVRDVTSRFHVYSQKIMQDLTMALEQAAISFDMQEKEEEVLIGIARSAQNQMDDILDNREIIEKHFLEVIGWMSKLKSLIDTPLFAHAGDAGESVEIF